MPRLLYDMHVIPFSKMPSALKLLQEHGFITQSLKGLEYKNYKANEVCLRDLAGFVSLVYYNK